MRQRSSKKDKSKFEKKFKARPPPALRPSRLSETPFLIAVVALVIFLVGGGLYTIVQQPPAIITVRDTFYYYVPLDVNRQLGGESMAAMIYLALGVGGVFAARSSVKYLYGAKQGFLMLVVGLVLMVLGVVGLAALYDLKLQAP